MPTISVFCVSVIKICVAHNKIYHGKSRHISLRYAYKRELALMELFLECVRSSNNMSEPPIKALNRD